MVRSSKAESAALLAEYDAVLRAAREPVAVLEFFAQGREARMQSGEEPLEVAFAATPVDGAEPLPAAVWVALRNGEVEASVAALLAASDTEFVVGEHQEMDENYRLRTIEDRRPLPDVALLQTQLATFLQIPRDVVTMLCGWGPDDPRTQLEIDALLDGRLGGGSPRPARASGLRMSATELTALLQLTPEQGRLLETLVRQADITITATE
jgi:hypothetical protein